MTTSNIDYLDADFENYVQSILDKHHVPGIAVAVINKGKIQTNGYGLARFPDVPATSASLWWAGSTTKAMIAALAGMLVHDPSKIKPDSKIKKVKWTTPLIDILGEDFKLPDPYMTANVTLEDALSHRSGLPGHDLCYGNWQGPNPRDMTRRVRYLGPEKTPMRSIFAYNNIMYAVAADAIEILTGLTIAEALKKYIWKPLGMNNTYWGIEDYAEIIKDKDSPQLSRGYTWIDKPEQDSDSQQHKEHSDKGYYVAGPYCALSCISAAGANLSSADDYAKWVMELLKASKKPDDDSTSKEETSSVITPELFKDLTTARMLVLPPKNLYPDLAPMPENPQFAPNVYALGWYNNPRMYPGTHIVMHAGGLDTYGSEVHFVPDLDFGVVTLGNTGGTSNLVGNIIVKELLGRKLGKSLEERRLVSEKGTKETEAAGSQPVAEGEMQKNAAVATEQPSQHKNPIVTTDDTSEDTPFNKSDDLKSFTGSYFNGAYGEYSVTTIPSSEASFSTTNPTFKGDRIIRKQDLSSHTTSSNNFPILNAQPVGHRTWLFTFLLHKNPSNPQIPSSSESPSKPPPKFLTLEKLNTFGDLSYDPIPGYPRKFGPSTLPDKNTSECRDEKVHMSGDIVPSGACFMVDSNGKQKMGMVLIRQSLERVREKQKEKAKEKKKKQQQNQGGDKKEKDINETKDDLESQDHEKEEELEEGWEDGMIWFEKI